ncbi:MAG: CHAD domain-containing protein [Lachnospiraceae bacterium]
MEKKIILIRHGKAEPREEVPDEAKRKLTETGIKEIEKILPTLKSHCNGLKLRLVSSALPRAVQTAELIANYMGIEEAERLDWVESGDYEGLRETYQSLDPAYTLAVVGHEPHLSGWSRRLCGSAIPFRKGGAAGFGITSQEPLSAWPEWMLLPETVHSKELKIQPCAAAASEFRKILRLHCHEVFQALHLFLGAPEDPTTGHQFRISVRTFRAVLSFIKPLLAPAQYTAVQNQMRQLSNQMGRLRELDVLKSEWLKLLNVYPVLEEEQSILVTVLTSERQREQDLVYSKRYDMMSVVFDVWNWIEDVLPQETAGMEETEGLLIPQSFSAFSEKRIKKQLKKINAGVEKITGNDYAAIHKVRIQIKKLRYTLSIIDPVLKLKREETIALLKSLQNVFGDYCDTHRNLFILENLAAPDNSVEMRYESALISGYQIRMMEENLDKIKAIKAV